MRTNGGSSFGRWRSEVPQVPASWRRSTGMFVSISVKSHNSQARRSIKDRRIQYSLIRSRFKTKTTRRLQSVRRDPERVPVAGDEGGVVNVRQVNASPLTRAAAQSRSITEQKPQPTGQAARRIQATCAVREHYSLLYELESILGKPIASLPS